MINRVKIKGYKSLADVETRLSPLSVLFGPNGAGKSNFLDALQLLSRTATSRTLKEAFEPPYRGKPLESFTFGPRGIRDLLDTSSASLSIEVDVTLSPAVVESVNQQILEMKRPRSGREGDANGAKHPSFVREKYLRYRLEIEINPRTGFLHVVDEYLAALTAQGGVSGKRKPFLERIGEKLHLRLEGQAHPTYHEIGLDHSIVSRPLYPPHYPHLTAIRQELASWFFFYLEPRERMRAPNSVKEVRHIGLMGEELAAFLNTLRALDVKHFQSVEKSLHVLIPSITRLDPGVNELGEVELRVIEGETPIPARILSEGTLRVLGLLSLGGAKEPPALLGFEEPENGIHPKRIQLVAELLDNMAKKGDTQVIVTTHSPIFLDNISHLNIGSLFVCRKVRGRTIIAPFADSHGPLWRSHSINQDLDREELPISERILRGDFDA